MDSPRMTYREPSTSSLSDVEDDSPDSGHGRSSYQAESDDDDDEMPLCLGPRESLPYLRPQEALEAFPDHFTEYEKEEILDYAEVYFCGLRVIWKKYLGEQNGGFDSASGWYNQLLGDHVAYRYEVLGYVDKGSSSTVHKAYDHKMHRFVALKCIKNTDGDKKNADREINILRHLNEKDRNGVCHVVRLWDSFVFRDHQFLAFDVITNTLLGFIKSKPLHRLDLSEIRKIARGMLRCLILLDQEDIVHVDMKPENIMIQGDNLDSLVVIDFGSSSFVDQRDKSIDYVQSRFYRAPEVILGLDFAKAVDMWSFGCILAELLMGRPLLYGEKNEEDQFAAIVEVFGDLPRDMVRDCKNNKSVYEKHFIGNCSTSSGSGYKYLKDPEFRDRKRPKRKPLASILSKYTADADFVDFVRRCLFLEPRGRLKPAAALQHPFLNRDPFGR